MDISKQLDSKSMEEFKLIRARGLANIQKTAKSVKLQTARRIAKKYGQGLDSATAAEMYKNCALSAACVLIDRWGMNFEKDICTALDLDPAELNDYLVEDEIAEAAETKPERDTLETDALLRVRDGLRTVERLTAAGRDAGPYIDDLRYLIDSVLDLDGEGAEQLAAALYKPFNKSWAYTADLQRCIDAPADPEETGTSAADDGTKSGTGAADPGTVSEIMKRLNRIEESLHSIGQQVEAIWLKTGAVELDAEIIAADSEETEPEQ